MFHPLRFCNPVHQFPWTQLYFCLLIFAPLSTHPTGVVEVGRGFPVQSRHLSIAKWISTVGENLRELAQSSAPSASWGVGVLVPVLLTLDTFSSSAAFLVHSFFSLPALPPKQFTYFPDITGASLCIWMLMLHLMDEIVQQRGQKLVPHQPGT